MESIFAVVKGNQDLRVRILINAQTSLEKYNRNHSASRRNGQLGLMTA